MNLRDLPLDKKLERIVSVFDAPQSAALYEFPVNENQSWLRKRLPEVRREKKECGND